MFSLAGICGEISYRDEDQDHIYEVLGTTNNSAMTHHGASLLLSVGMGILAVYS